MDRYACGFSLVECLCTLIIVSIIAMIALPPLNTMLENSNRTQVTNQLLATLHFARSTAVYQRGVVTVCPGVTQCTGERVWNASLMVFHDTNRNGQLDMGEQVIRLESLLDDYSWRWASFRQGTFIQFEANGTTLAHNGTFTLCKEQQPQRQVVISLSGRARTQAPAGTARC